MEFPMSRLLMTIVLSIFFLAQKSHAMEQGPATNEAAFQVSILTIMLPLLSLPLGHYLLQTYNSDTTSTDLRNDPGVRVVLDLISPDIVRCNHCLQLTRGSNGQLTFIEGAQPTHVERAQIIECIVYCEANSRS